MKRLENKNVLITGSSSGIGKDIAIKFAKEKANIGIHYSKNKVGAIKLAKELSKITKVKIYHQDFLSNKLNIVHKFVKDFGSIDILINNAGIFGSKSFLNISYKDYDKMFKINSRAAFILSKDAFKYMKKKKSGRIINISSVTTKFGRGRNNSIQYASSKATLDILTKGLSIIGAKYNILVNSISPGIIMTKHQRYRKDIKERINLIPLKRAGSVKDVSNLVIYLSSNNGDFITGEVFTISGGE